MAESRRRYPGPHRSAATVVELIATHDNDGLGQDSCAAIDVGELIIDAGTELPAPGCNNVSRAGLSDFPLVVEQLGRVEFLEQDMRRG